MADTSNAAELPAPEAGANSQPNLSVVPTPKKRRVPAHSFALTQAQRAELELTLHLCTEGLKPAHAGPLESNTVSPAFLTTLQQDAKAAETVGRAAINATNSKEGCTAEEAVAKASLMENLRKMQSAARAAYADTEPHRVNNYLVGNDIAANRATLESSAVTIVGQANTDRPGDINTDFIVATTTKQTAYVTSNSAQQTDLGTGKQERLQRNALIKSICARRKKVQRAADSAWPHTNPANAKARTVFRLPPNRPYSY